MDEEKFEYEPNATPILKNAIKSPIENQYQDQVLVKRLSNTVHGKVVSSRHPSSDPSSGKMIMTNSEFQMFGQGIGSGH
jgi:hypothetical protein